jgi:hypothetical protein
MCPHNDVNARRVATSWVCVSPPSTTDHIDGHHGHHGHHGHQSDRPIHTPRAPCPFAHRAYSSDGIFHVRDDRDDGDDDDRTPVRA